MQMIVTFKCTPSKQSFLISLPFVLTVYQNKILFFLIPSCLVEGERAFILSNHKINRVSVCVVYVDGDGMERN